MKGSEMTRIENEVKAVQIQLQTLIDKKVGLENLLAEQNKHLKSHMNDIN